MSRSEPCEFVSTNCPLNGGIGLGDVLCEGIARASWEGRREASEILAPRLSPEVRAVEPREEPGELADPAMLDPEGDDNFREVGRVPRGA